MAVTRVSNTNNRKSERIYQLTVGDYNNGKGFQLTSEDTDRPLQMTFTVDKASDNKKTHTGNTASIEVYNLSPEQERMLDSRFIEATLYVGYKDGDGLKLLCSGNLTECSTTKRGTDSITQMVIGEGYVNLTQSKLSRILSPGQTVQDVLNVITDNMPGIARGPMVGTNLNSPLIHGWRLNGTAKEELDKITKAYKLEYNITGETLTVTDVNGPFSKSVTTVPVISETTGMVEAPFRTTEKVQLSKNDKRVRYGIQVKVLLDAALVPSQVIRLEYGGITGYYRIRAVQYTGDFRGNNWYAELQCNAMEGDDVTVV
jgi:hypothetical protein